MSKKITQYLRDFNGSLSCILSKNTQQPPEGAYHVNFSRLELVISGHYTVIVPNDNESKRIQIPASEMFFVPQNTWYKPTWKDDCHLLSILFGKNQIGFSSVVYIKNMGFSDIRKHSTPITNSLFLEKMLDSLSFIQDLKTLGQVADHLAKAILDYCKVIFFRTQNTKLTRSEKLYGDMCLYINENFYKNITRDDLSKQFNISTSHISRIFHQSGNMKFSDYVNNIRLENAKKMLISESYRIEEISHRCGFKDINYFCRVFKQKTQLTPSEFRLKKK